DRRALPDVRAVHLPSSDDTEKRRARFRAKRRQPNHVSAGTGANSQRDRGLPQRGMPDADRAPETSRATEAAMKVAITGVTGFVGSHLARRLEARGVE